MMDTSDLITWLLGTTIPSIRYFTLRNLLHLPETDADVLAAREAMARTGPVPAILARQTPKGDWIGDASYYTPKYTSTHWSMVLLVELGADPATPQLQLGADFMLANTRGELQSLHWLEPRAMDCFWGNLLRYSLHAGRGQTEAVQDLIDLLTRNGLEGGWRCPINGSLPCAWGVARSLWGLAAVPAEQRSSEVVETINKGLAFLLEEHELLGGRYPAVEKIHPLWERLSFPLFYSADVLFVLRVAAELGALDHPGAQLALEWLAKRRTKAGHWKGANPYGSRTYRELGDRGETSRWISLQAAQVLSLT